MRNIVLLNALLILALLSCNTQKNKEKEEAKSVKTENIFIGSKTYKSIKCRKDSTQKYTAYFPENYSQTSKLPVIVVFDAHARTKLVVEKFKEAADKFTYLIIASENVKNGLKTVDYSINTLFDDIFSKFKIDRKRVYTAGFSGGARIANSVAIYKGGISGVISCSGGLPQKGVKIKNKFDFVGIVGLNDFNYQEMKALNKAFDNENFNNKFISFNGTHDWPDSKVISEAVEYLEIIAIKRKIVPTNDNLVRSYTYKNAEIINDFIINGEDYKAYLLYKSFLQSLKGLYDISDYEKSYQVLLNSPKIKSGIELDKQISEKETLKQHFFIDLFKQSNFPDLKKEISILQGKTKNNTESHLENRLLNYTEMLCYIFTENLFKTSDFKNFNQLIETYELINSKNADKEYFKAAKYAIDGNEQEALKSLNKAVDFGFFDKEKLLNSVYFNNFKNTDEFLDVLTRIEK